MRRVCRVCRVCNVARKSSTKLDIKMREGLKKRPNFGTSVKLVWPAFFILVVKSDLIVLHEILQ